MVYHSHTCVSIQGDRSIDASHIGGIYPCHVPAAWTFGQEHSTVVVTQVIFQRFQRAVFPRSLKLQSLSLPESYACIACYQDSCLASFLG